MSFVRAANGQPLPRASVPVLSEGDFAAEILGRVRAGCRIAAFFAVPNPLTLWAVLLDPREATLWIGAFVPEQDRFASLTPALPQIQLFERNVWEKWGILPEGHPRLRPVRFAPPLRKGRQLHHPIGVMERYAVAGDEVHEVAVGPVHAGVIEPGHFRFQCRGETVLHLEISLGYQHRGVERALLGGPDKRSIHLVETLAGDTTVAHTTAHAELREGLAGVVAPARAQALRGVALELERLANHTGDLGALAGDVGYLPTASFCGRLRGDWLNLTAALCGNRFGRGLVVPGGVRFDADDARCRDMIGRLDKAVADLRPSVQLLWDTPGVMSRFEETGVVTQAIAEQIGLVGLSARASGLVRDVRYELPSGIWRYEQVALSTWGSGDVFARAWVRGLEVDRSASFVRARLDRLPESATRVPIGAAAPEHVCVALVEGWRGEVVHAAVTDADGRFAAYEVVDPSFHDWWGLEMALRGTAISDFPLCNKSFNLSYCGFDL